MVYPPGASGDWGVSVGMRASKAIRARHGKPSQAETAGQFGRFRSIVYECRTRGNSRSNHALCSKIWNSGRCPGWPVTQTRREVAPDKDGRWWTDRWCVCTVQILNHSSWAEQIIRRSSAVSRQQTLRIGGRWDQVRYSGIPMRSLVTKDAAQVGQWYVNPRWRVT